MKAQNADSTLSSGGAGMPNAGAIRLPNSAVPPPMRAAAATCALRGSKWRSAATIPSPAWHQHFAHVAANQHQVICASAGKHHFVGERTGHKRTRGSTQLWTVSASCSSDLSLVRVNMSFCCHHSSTSTIYFLLLKCTVKQPLCISAAHEHDVGMRMGQSIQGSQQRIHNCLVAAMYPAATQNIPELCEHGLV